MREDLRSLLVGLDGHSAKEELPSSVAENKSVQLRALEDQLARLQRLLNIWSRAKYRGIQGATILSNELRVQCEEMVASARLKLSELTDGISDSSG